MRWVGMIGWALAILWSSVALMLLLWDSPRPRNRRDPARGTRLPRLWARRIRELSK